MVNLTINNKKIQVPEGTTILAAAAPVSYTHLDVYKRQLYRSADHSGIDESFKCWGTVDLQRLLSVYQM